MEFWEKISKHAALLREIEQFKADKKEIYGDGLIDALTVTLGKPVLGYHGEYNPKKREIILHHERLLHRGPEQLRDLLEHEFGHYIQHMIRSESKDRDKSLSLNRIKECEADHYAIYFGATNAYENGLYDMIKTIDSKRTKPDIATTHPKSVDRFPGFHMSVLQELPPGYVEFDDRCQITQTKELNPDAMASYGYTISSYSYSADSYGNTRLFLDIPIDIREDDSEHHDSMISINKGYVRYASQGFMKGTDVSIPLSELDEETQASIEKLSAALAQYSQDFVEPLTGADPNLSIHIKQIHQAVENKRCESGCTPPM